MAEVPVQSPSPFPPLDPTLSPEVTEAPTDAGPAPASRPAPPIPPAMLPTDDPQMGADRFIDQDADHNECTYATFNHLVGLLTFVNAGVPLMGVLATLIMWRIRRDRSPFLDDHGREALNFQVTLFIYFVVIVSAIFPTLGLAALGLPLMAVLALWGCLRGALAAHRGEYYRYPVTFRIFKAAHERD